MKNKKAEGIVKIGNTRWSNIFHLFNGKLETGKILEELCEGLIAPIHEEDVQSNTENYTCLIHF